MFLFRDENLSSLVSLVTSDPHNHELRRETNGLKTFCELSSSLSTIIGQQLLLQSYRTCSLPAFGLNDSSMALLPEVIQISLGKISPWLSEAKTEHP